MAAVPVPVAGSSSGGVFIALGAVVALCISSSVAGSMVNNRKDKLIQTVNTFTDEIQPGTYSAEFNEMGVNKKVSFVIKAPTNVQYTYMYGPPASPPTYSRVFLNYTYDIVSKSVGFYSGLAPYFYGTYDASTGKFQITSETANVQSKVGHGYTLTYNN
jgi:hypothetical protein